MSELEFPPDEPRNRPRALVVLMVAVVTLGILGAAAVLPFALTMGHAAEKAADRFLNARCDVHETAPAQRSTMYASDGRTVLAHFFVQNRTPVRLADVPHELVRALVDTEDRRFYDHHGVDLRGLARAALHDASGGDTQGGSTLTMQYVKQVRYYQATTAAGRQAAIAPTIDRKMQNAKCALELERRLTKNQILEKYLNIAFFGENAYGVATAANTYFGVSPRKLTVPQSALLVGLLQAPSQYDPFAHAGLARERRNQVLANLADVGDLDRNTALRYEQAPLGLAGHKPPPVREGCAAAAIPNAGFFCDYAVDWLRSHGVSASALTTRGLKIVSTLDARLQRRGQAAVWRSGLPSAADYALVMPSVDPRTGGVTSMISTRRYGLDGDRRAHSVEPLFTAAYAGAGSTYKYFTAATALTAGAPTSLKLSTPGNEYRARHCGAGHYKVHNAGNYPTTMTLRDALPESSNTYFVAIEDEFFGCHLGPIVDTATRLGMHRLEQPRTPSASGSIAHEVVHSQEPTFTLGQEPTSALELTGAFGAAANDGVFCPPRPVLRITSATGAAVHVRTEACRRVLTPYVARTLTDLMRRDTRSGTAASYFQQWYSNGGSDVAGKTGTDNDANDTGNSALWFVGSTPHLVAAAALVNPRNPKQTVHGLPGQPAGSVGQDTFGAYASRFWLTAYGPALRHHWSWPEPGGLGGDAVPPVIGRSAGAAKAALHDAGFRVDVFPVACASDVPAGQVAYQQPPKATSGATVTICLSSGKAPYVEAPPPAPPVRKHAPPRRTAPPKPKPKPPGHGPPKHHH